MPEFCHLHCHTQYSLLDGAAPINGMISKAKENGMKAVAITDHGNMFGAFNFAAEAQKQGVKPIIGCEFYVVEDRFKNQFTRAERDERFHQLILAKNQSGYENLSKLCSLGFLEGLYGKYPRVDFNLISQYKEGLIATTCCIGAEVPKTILQKGIEQGEKVFLKWLNLFGHGNYYIELQRHGLMNIDNTGMSQEDINQILISWSKKYEVPVIATNDSHYVDKEDFEAHDILLCINTGDLKKTPVGEGKGFRFGFSGKDFFFKTKEQMAKLFEDIPQALDNTILIAESIEAPKLTRDVLLPNYILPSEFSNQGEYLRHLAYQGAYKRYHELTSEVVERLEFELQTIIQSGYPGYFLIVQDFTTAARELDVWVGPGRGSAAGSVVAYVLGITNVDPLKYNLLFERFLNPERVSMPDIDIDFDDEGRQKVIDYVLNKYGKNQVAQIITYGSMAAKGSLRDVGRVMDISLPTVDRITKLFPEHPSATLKDLLKEGGIDANLKLELNKEQLSTAENFRKIAEEKNEIGEWIRTAAKLEGSVRNTGIHACGVIITPDDITKYIPVTKAKDNELLVSQFDNNAMEKSGLLKMDFLGLRTLSILKDSIRLVTENHGVNIVPDEIPLDDPLTFQLFQRGETNAIFQYESPGMQNSLKQLKPERFEDLIAMNALYRPGPIKYIRNFAARKNGLEKVVYDLPECKEFLEETYGITVYQEQVMLLSQKLAGFSKGEADTLRKAMGKKQKEVLDKMKSRFMEGCANNGLPAKTCEKIWNDWEDFASYAFNKSHSTCYAYLAFHTAYLKAHYPAEFMASVLTHNMSNIANVQFFLQECKRLRIQTLGPDVNESQVQFSVNKQGAVRFALSALKGVGELAAEEIVNARKSGGPYKGVFDLCCRVNLRTVNKRALESLAYGGGFDGFTDIHRAQYFFNAGGGETLIEKSIKYGNQFQSGGSSLSNSLFADDSSIDLKEPSIPKCEEWSLMERLNHEKAVTGMYVSGQPMDAYSRDIFAYVPNRISELETLKGKNFKLAGILVATNTRFDKNGNLFCTFTIEDSSGTVNISVFKNDYLKHKNYLETTGLALYLEGSYREKKYQKDEYEINIQSVCLLSEVRDKKLETLYLYLDKQCVDLNAVESLYQILHFQPGDKKVNLVVVDYASLELLYLYMKNHKVSVNNEVLDQLEAIPGVRVYFKKPTIEQIFVQDIEDEILIDQNIELPNESDL